MKIAIYARVSSETQAKEGTIESQIETLRDYAKTKKLTVVSECIDDGYSGTILDRPGLDQLRDLAQVGSIEGILFLSPDRLSRKQAHQILLLEEFKKRNIQIIFTNQNFSDSPEDNLMLQIQGAVAEYERTKILDRMRRGIIHSVKKGQVIGNNPPYGYNYIPKSKDAVGHWEINPEEAVTIRYIFDLYVNQGLTGTAITNKLNDESLPCRSTKWWSGQVYLILKSETYAGTAHMFRYKRAESRKHPKARAYQKKKNNLKVERPQEDWVSVSVPPIIERETWEKAQALLKQNARLSRRNNHKHNYLLRGLVVCGLCESMASGYVSNKTTYYSCRAKRGKNITAIRHDELVQVRHNSFDEKVWNGLGELLGNPENLKAQQERRLQIKKANLQTVQAPNASSKELEQLAIQEKRIIDAYREEVISLEELKMQKEKIASVRKTLEAKKATVPRHTESAEQPKITMAMLGDVSARFERVMRKADFSVREKLTRLLVTSVMLYPNKAVVSGNIPLISLDALSLTAPSR
jgi:site-specific DNA recombinase